MNITKLFLFVLIIMVSISCAHVEPVRENDGTQLPGSVAFMEKVRLGGTEQWIFARGCDERNPVLLWLDGGPGGSEIGWVRSYLEPLEKSFTVVCWDQRGTAGSWNAVADKKSLKVEDYVSDTIELSRLLANRFGQEKIYLAGHSGGTIWGLMAAAHEPNLFAAYVGVAQQVNAIENDRIGWEMVRAGAAAEGKLKVVAKLDEMGPPPYGIDGGKDYLYVFSRLHRYSPHAPAAGRFDSFLMLKAKEHTLIDNINLIRGLLAGVEHVYPQLENLDFERDLRELGCPVFFANGRYDMTCVATITERYFTGLRAPLKKLEWFELSGHNPCYTENEKFIDFMVDTVLGSTR
ncbi:alpha/beta hydrolase [Treponema sp.]